MVTPVRGAELDSHYAVGDLLLQEGPVAKFRHW